MNASANVARVARIVLISLLLCALVVVVWFLMFTEHGRVLRDDPHKLGQTVRDWVQHHYLIAPLICLFIYLVFAAVAFPVWWIQVLAGYGFGLIAGIFWCEISAAIAAALTLMVSRFLAADWFHLHVEAKLAKLRAIDEKMGHNGLLVVIGVRLAHFLPFGLCNYALGLTRVTPMDAFVGTLIGTLPSSAAYVSAGAKPNLWKDWRFVVSLIAVNLLMFIPVVLRYLRPQWFKKIGIE